MIVRLYEAYNARTDVTLTAGFDFKRAVLCDLMENEVQALEADGRTVKLPVLPYEILTVKFEL